MVIARSASWKNQAMRKGTDFQGEEHKTGGKIFYLNEIYWVGNGGSDCTT